MSNNFDPIKLLQKGLESRIDEIASSSLNKFNLEHLFVPTKDREVLNLTDENLFEPQIEIKNKVWRLTENGLLKNQKHVVLKPRQIGSSTLAVAMLFLDTINNPNTTTLIIAHEKSTASKLLDLCKQFHACCLGGPELTTANQDELAFGSINSKIVIGTAKNFQFGRGFTTHNFLGTEIAFWDQPGKLLAGIMESIPITGNIILESTANGEGDYFHDLVIDSQNDLTGFTFHFYPWFLMSSYKETPEPNFTPQTSGQFENEVRLMELFGLTHAQLQFRRTKIRAKGRDGCKIFKQEYPSTVAEAFIGSGETLFDEDGLAELKTISQDFVIPLSRFPHRLTNLRGLQAREVNFTELPSPLEEYIISCDPSEGLNEEGDHDYASIGVLKRSTWELIGHISTRTLGPGPTGKLLVELSRYYNNAELLVERNNHGHAVLESIFAEKHDRKLVYNYVDWEIKKGQRIKFHKPGFPANVKTVSLAIDALKSLILDRQIIIYSSAALAQLGSYRKLKNGKYGAPKGKHDDDVSMLRMLAFRLLSGTTVEKKRVKKPTLRRQNTGVDYS